MVFGVGWGSAKGVGWVLVKKKILTFLPIVRFEVEFKVELGKKANKTVKVSLAPYFDINCKLSD